MRNKLYQVLLSTFICMCVNNVSAVTNDFASLDTDDGTFSSSTPDSSDQGPLGAKFTSSRTYKSFNDVLQVFNSLKIKTVVSSQSSQVIPPQGIKIQTNGTIQDYVNRVSNQFGYTWSFNSDTNTLAFIAINPVVPKPVIPTPSPVPTDTPQPMKLSSKNNSLTTTTISSTTDNVKVWTLNPTRDRNVREGMMRWAKEAGWQLVWKGAYDMPVEVEVKVPGSFEFAINEICRASQATGKQLLAEMHDKNKVVVIYTAGVTK